MRKVKIKKIFKMQIYLLLVKAAAPQKVLYQERMQKLLLLVFYLLFSIP